MVSLVELILTERTMTAARDGEKRKGKILISGCTNLPLETE